MTSFFEKFQKIYDDNIWSNGSGPGSDIQNIQPYIDYLQAIIDSRQIKSIVDCGCGDWQSTRYLNLNGVDYLGIDIVPKVINDNIKSYSAPNIKFQFANFLDIELPKADLLICKDVLQHLPNEAVLSFLTKIKEFRLALITNDEGDNCLRNYLLENSPYYYAPISLMNTPFMLQYEEAYSFLGNKVAYLIGDTNQIIRYHLDDYYRLFANKVDSTPKKILIAILAKQKEAVLPFYLKCLEMLHYPKQYIFIYIRTNNNTDNTVNILREWVAQNESRYGKIEMDESDVAENIEQFGVHEWNSVRFSVLAKIRQQSLLKTLEWGCDFYFVADVDNFLRRNTLLSLVNLNLPIVGPLLRLATDGMTNTDVSEFYSNYHYDIDEKGYYRNCEQYYWVLLQKIKGIIDVKVIHCTYLIRADVIPDLHYYDDSGRHEYVIFSDSARQHNIPQYIDNREIYGFLTFDENSIAAEKYLGFEVNNCVEQKEI
jgi:SAM-dependent methyltransferase